MPNGSWNRRSFERTLWDHLTRRWKTIAVAGPLLVAGLVGLATSFYTVGPESQAVVKRFGRVIGPPRKPGLHFKLPFWIDRAYVVPTERVHKEEFGFRTVKAAQRTAYEQLPAHEMESTMLTGDLNVVDVEWVVQYRIIDPEKWLHHVRDPVETIRVVAEAVMRRIVGNRLGSEVLTIGRVEIAAAVQTEMNEILGPELYDLGVHVTAVEMQDVTPPDPVKPAFNEVNEARQERERLINEAEKLRNQAIPQAKGEALEIVAEAEGYRAERVNRALGEASRFQAILEEYRKAPEITRRRLHLETIETVLPEVGRIFVLPEGGHAPLPLLDLGWTEEGR